MKKSLYKKLRSKKNLWDSWCHVRNNCLQSHSTTRAEAIKFEKNYSKNIERINRELLRNNFIFKESKGVLLKGNRPIVVSPVSNKIVQRAILILLQNDERIKKIIYNSGSYGGLENRGVRLAINEVYNEIRSGKLYFIKSDIKKFFQKIPRKKTIDLIVSIVEDDSINDILNKATIIELHNANLMGDHMNLFPSFELGVGQGICLSPFFCNVLLSDFDNILNTNKIRCIRYIDDFIILGHTKKEVRQAFRECKKVLKGLELEVYDPSTKDERAKACEGATKNTFEFLGCKISYGYITPNSKSINNLLLTIDKYIKESKYNLTNSNSVIDLYDYSLTSTFYNIHNSIRAWGSQYSFCNNYQVMDNLDLKINTKIQNYIQFYDNLKRKNPKNDIRRLVGVQLLSDIKKAPIIS